MFRILILANCQATALARIIEGVIGQNGTAQFEVIPCQPFFELPASAEDDVLQKLKLCDVLLYQPHFKGKWTPEWRTSNFWVKYCSAKHIISFPSLFFSGYNPELTYIKKPNGRHLNEGFSDYHDKRILKFYLDGCSESIAKRDLFRLKLSEKSVKANLEAAIAELNSREESDQLDVKVSEFILANYRKERLFYTVNHPSNYLLYFVVDEVIRILNIKNVIRPRLTQELLKYDVYPISGAVSKALKLDFDCSDELYLIQNKVMTARELISTYYKIYKNNHDAIEGYRESIENENWHQKKRVLFHIGQSKTATTALQHLMRNNVSALLEQGYFYPSNGFMTVAHFEVSSAYLNNKNSNSFSLFIKKAFSKSVNDGPIITRVIREFEQSQCHTMVLSSEAFESFNEKHIEALYDDFCDYEVEVVCVLRGRIGWLNSMYSEVVKKALYVKTFDEFLNPSNGFLEKSLSYKLNSQYFLQPWLNLFSSRLTVFNMDDGAPLAKLLNFFGVNVVGDIEKDFKGKSNESVSSYTIEVLRRFYVEHGINELDYVKATNFMMRVEYAVNNRQLCVNRKNGFFSSDQQLLDLTSSYLKDDLYLAKNFKFSRNDLGKNSLEYFDFSHADSVFDNLKPSLLKWYDQSTATLQ